MKLQKMKNTPCNNTPPKKQKKTVLKKKSEHILAPPVNKTGAILKYIQTKKTNSEEENKTNTQTNTQTGIQFEEVPEKRKCNSEEEQSDRSWSGEEYDIWSNHENWGVSEGEQLQKTI